MLLDLRIHRYAVIDNVSLSLGPGLSVLTGETGAGKSIVVGALSLLLGERASSEVVRAGADSAVVEAVFDVRGHPKILERLEGLGLQSEEGVLVLRREVQAEGRNRAWVNGGAATAATVGELGSALVDIHGQHEHQALLRDQAQRRILDAFGALTREAERVAAAHEGLRSARKALEDRKARARQLEERGDLLRFQLGEIEAAELVPAEEEAAEEEIRRLEHAAELAEDASRLHDGLYSGDGSVSELLAEVKGTLERMARADPSLGDAVTAVENAYHQVVEVGRRLGGYAQEQEPEPARLEVLQQRHDFLFRLKGKYGPTFDDILATEKRLRAELQELDDASADVSELEKRVEVKAAEWRASAERLSAGRLQAADRLSRAVREVLPALGMKGAQFEVDLSAAPEPGPGGLERVSFLVSLNPGFEPSPLSQVASGGELSRVMLALESVLASVDQIPTLVFDEIDSGVGGVVATAVAAKLRDVARHHQVLVITHLPQIASRADAHLRVDKALDSDGVSSVVLARLGGEERVREIARMLGGDPDSERSRDHARELLKPA